MPQIFNIYAIYSKFTVTARDVSVCYVNTQPGFKIKDRIFKAQQNTTFEVSSILVERCMSKSWPKDLDG